MSTNMPNLKQIGGGHRKNGQKFVDLMWNDPLVYTNSLTRTLYLIHVGFDRNNFVSNAFKVTLSVIFAEHIREEE